MNESSQVQPIVLQDQGNKSKRSNSNVRIVKIEPRTDQISAPQQVDQDQASDFEFRVASFKPVCDKVWGILDGIGCKAVEYSAGKLSKDQRQKIVGAVKLSSESREVAASCSSRLLARRIENPSTVDILGLCGVFTEWASGIAVAVIELRNISREEKLLASHGRQIKDAERSSTLDAARE